MATQKQLLANRENSKKGGVKTTVGKNKIRLNAVKHALSGSKLVYLSGFGEDDYIETEEDYNHLLAGIIDSVNPQSALEDSLVHQMTSALFKLARADYIEAHAFNHKFTCDFDLEQVLRYRTAIENQFIKAIKTLVAIKETEKLGLFGNTGECKND